MSINYSFSVPVLTAELLKDILSGRDLLDPNLHKAIRIAKESGTYTCPYCHGVNDGIMRIKSCGMGVESIALFLEQLFNPKSRDFCLCQLVIITMQTGDEYADTLQNMETYILPLYRYYRLRFVELARGGEQDRDGIVILQDTRCPRRMHGEGFYKLSDHYMRNGTVPQVGSQRLCSIRFKGWVGDYWLNNCLGLTECHHLFGFNAGESDRAEESKEAITKHNRASASKSASKSKRGATTPPRVRLRTSGDKIEDYQLMDLSFEEIEEASKSKEHSGSLKIIMAFGFNASEASRAQETAQYDGMKRATLVGDFDPTDFRILVSSNRALRRVGVFPLIQFGWGRLKCTLSIYLQLGIVWKKSHCGACPFSKDSSKCTPHGVARNKLHPELTARSLLMEYGSLCLNERGMLYVRKSLQMAVLSSQQTRALELFETLLNGMEFSLFEVKRIYSQKGKASRSVIRLATGTRQEMTLLFTKEAKRLSLKIRTVHGINYATFAERGETYPALEGFLVVAPAHIREKVRGDFALFEQRFAEVAHESDIKLPLLPGTELVGRPAFQTTLFGQLEAA